MIFGNHALLTAFRHWLAAQPRPADAYLVGGSVRDAHLERSPPDVDLAVAGDAPALCQAFAAHAGATFVPLGERFGCVRLVMDGAILDASGLQGGSIEEDLARRDFTMNAMALPIDAESPTDRLIDPFGGRGDLRLKIIRAVSAQNLEEDPLRLLRAFRFAAALDGRIEPSTLETIRSLAPLIRSVAAERVLQELKITLAAPRTAGVIRLMAETGLLFSLIPELAAAAGCPQNVFHSFDVWEHTLATLDEAEQILGHPDSCPALAAPARSCIENPGQAALLKLAILLHDAAKPRCRGVREDGRITFYGHEREGADLAAAIAERLRASRAEAATLERLVLHHLRPYQLARDNARPSALLRLLKDVDSDLDGLLLLCLSDIRAKGMPGSDEEPIFLRLAARLLELRERERTTAPEQARLLSGFDVQEAFGLSPSPLIGELLETVQDARADGLIQSREDALDLVRRMLREKNLPV